jgi:hypothetical protein
MLEFWFREYVDGDAANEPLEYAVLTARDGVRGGHPGRRVA